jgi:dCTP deaminase
MILGKEKILNEIKRGNLKIEPFNVNNIKGSSIDLILDNKFRVFNRDVDGEDYKKYSRLITKNEIILEPGDFILGITKEKITLKNLCGWLQGRSTYARIGLGIHVTANFIHPGVSNRQVLEIKNLNNYKIKIKSGMKICQLIIERVEGKYILESKFKKQVSL